MTWIAVFSADDRRVPNYPDLDIRRPGISSIEEVRTQAAYFDLGILFILLRRRPVNFEGRLSICLRLH